MLHVRCSGKALSKVRTVHILLGAYNHSDPATDCAIRKILAIQRVKFQPVGHYRQRIRRDPSYLAIFDLAESGCTFRFIAKGEDKIPFYCASGLEAVKDSLPSPVW